MRSQFIKIIYLPLFIFGGLGFSIYVVESQLNLLWLVGIMIFFISVSFLFEWLEPYDEDFNRPKGDRARDFYHALVNEVSSILSIMSAPFIASFVSITPVWPTDLALWLQLLIALIIADIGITLAHFVSHRIDFLWRLHAVHHSVKRMYGFNGLMKHPIHQSIETLAGAAPLLLMGIPQQVLALVVVAVLLQLLIQHSNVSYYVGPFKKIYITNQVHRFHHLNNAEEGDVNFGLFFTFTDGLLGTIYFDNQRTVASKDIGIGNQPNYPDSYLKQLIEPFRLTKKQPQK